MLRSCIVSAAVEVLLLSRKGGRKGSALQPNLRRRRSFDNCIQTQKWRLPAVPTILAHWADTTATTAADLQQEQQRFTSSISPPSAACRVSEGETLAFSLWFAVTIVKVNVSHRGRANKWYRGYSLLWEMGFMSKWTSAFLKVTQFNTRVAVSVVLQCRPIFISFIPEARYVKKKKKKYRYLWTSPIIWVRSA